MERNFQGLLFINRELGQCLSKYKIKQIPIMKMKKMDKKKSGDISMNASLFLFHNDPEIDSNYYRNWIFF